MAVLVQAKSELVLREEGGGQGHGHNDRAKDASKRVIAMLEFRVDELREFLELLLGNRQKGRLFPYMKYLANQGTERRRKATRLERIRVYDLRHSNVSPLINMGFTTLVIADRMGN